MQARHMAREGVYVLRVMLRLEVRVIGSDVQVCGSQAVWAAGLWFDWAFGRLGHVSGVRQVGHDL